MVISCGGVPTSGPEEAEAAVERVSEAGASEPTRVAPLGEAT
jgi:hypothetical protein